MKRPKSRTSDHPDRRPPCSASAFCSAWSSVRRRWCRVRGAVFWISGGLGPHRPRWQLCPSVGGHEGDKESGRGSRVFAVVWSRFAEGKTTVFFGADFVSWMCPCHTGSRSFSNSKPTYNSILMIHLETAVGDLLNQLVAFTQATYCIISDFQVSSGCACMIQDHSLLPT